MTELASKRLVCPGRLCVCVCVLLGGGGGGGGG